MDVVSKEFPNNHIKNEVLKESHTHMKSDSTERRTILYLTEIIESIEKSETWT